MKEQKKEQEKKGITESLKKAGISTIKFIRDHKLATLSVAGLGYVFYSHNRMKKKDMIISQQNGMIMNQEDRIRGLEKTNKVTTFALGRQSDQINTLNDRIKQLLKD